MSDREIVSALAWRQRFGKFANIIVVLAVFAVPFLIPAGLLMLVDGKTDKAIILLAAGVVDILILVIGNKQLKKFTARTKELEGEYIVKNVLSERIDITQYSPNGYINRNYVKACSILPKFNRIKGSDYTTGYYRGREFTFCDLLLEWESESRDSDGHTHTHITTEFEGQVSGEHSIGHAKKEYLRESVGDTAYGLMGAIKKVFDPDGILNPGKVCG